jgi:hypothetical protein
MATLRSALQLVQPSARVATETQTTYLACIALHHRLGLKQQQRRRAAGSDTVHLQRCHNARSGLLVYRRRRIPMTRRARAMPLHMPLRECLGQYVRAGQAKLSTEAEARLHGQPLALCCGQAAAGILTCARWPLWPSRRRLATQLQATDGTRAERPSWPPSACCLHSMLCRKVSWVGIRPAIWAGVQLATLCNTRQQHPTQVHHVCVELQWRGRR